MAEVMISVVPAERRRMRLASSVSRRAPKSWEADRYRKLRKPSSWFWVLERSRTRRSRPRRIPSRRASRSGRPAVSSWMSSSSGSSTHWKVRSPEPSTGLFWLSRR